jgi:hypothetical protein
MRSVDTHWITVNTGEVRERPVSFGVLYIICLMLRCAAKHLELTEGLSPQASAEVALTRYLKMGFESLHAACTGPGRVN